MMEKIHHNAASKLNPNYMRCAHKKRPSSAMEDGLWLWLEKPDYKDNRED